MPTSNPAEFRVLSNRAREIRVFGDQDCPQSRRYDDHQLQLGETRSHRPRRIAGPTTKESTELMKARRRIRELEAEVVILRRAHVLRGRDVTSPKTGWAAGTGASSTTPCVGSPGIEDPQFSTGGGRSESFIGVHCVAHHQNWLHWYLLVISYYVRHN